MTEIFFTYPVITALLGLVLGSFLHASAHRLAFDKEFFLPRSHCPQCNALIAWYDNIPVISWIFLKGHCRHCQGKISFMYPFIEIVTALCLTALWHSSPIITSAPKLSYTLFLCALVVATATDLHTFVIPQIVSLWLAPIGVLLAAGSFLPITLTESICGATLGYGSLWMINFIFKKLRKLDGMGVGDMELFCMIGAFIGPLGLWHTLLIASCTGTLWGLASRLFSLYEHTIIPFGPFLALGSFVHLFIPPCSLRFFL